MHEWLLFSLGLLAIWIIIFLFNSYFRKEMLLISLLTAIFGLTQPLFVPEYWSPDPIFHFAYGFDIESIIFCFAIGGIGAVLYDLVLGKEYTKMTKDEIKSEVHKLHRLVLASPFLIFAILYLAVDWNPIYIAAVSMAIGGLATIYCRPSLTPNVFYGGFLFAMLYFAFFVLMNTIFPDFLKFWNLEAISGILVAGVPIEEIMFAFSFGMLWSGFYEHTRWLKIQVRDYLNRKV